MPVQQFQGSDSKEGRVDGLGAGTTYDAAVRFSFDFSLIVSILDPETYSIKHATCFLYFVQKG